MMRTQGRWILRLGFFMVVFVAVVWGVTAVYAGGFHHHGTDETAHESCPLCLALLKGFDLPAAPVFLQPDQVVADGVLPCDVPPFAYICACPHLRAPPASR